MKRVSLLVSAFAVAGLCPAAQGQAPSNADWPCVQRKVPVIAAGTVWSGPDLQKVGPWQSDADAAALAQRLASRRTRPEEVGPLIDEFLAKIGEHRAERLTRVFAGVLEIVNTERSRVIAGIERYARGQGKLAERIRKEADEVSAARDEPAVQLGKDLQDLETRFQWDKRIFEERAQALRSVCDTPVLLEHHLFEIARRIQERL
ncbi:hypothetical protein [Microvirga makkahensis]|uniref:Uncharacterized protein n=1 Tax=Microvirga makkahensis TaxID=1128670 RepID=A0A7X3SP41_9HYPH|nr:hypothetical protein [Microvirga makkahensis]MXQ12062.1 hypothetical protein [Microvirga makkahensis]